MLTDKFTCIFNMTVDIHIQHYISRSFNVVFYLQAENEYNIGNL